MMQGRNGINSYTQFSANAYFMPPGISPEKSWNVIPMKIRERLDYLIMPISCFLGYMFYFGMGGLFVLFGMFLYGLLFFNRKFSERVFGVIIYAFMNLLVRFALPMLGVFKMRERSGFDNLPSGPVILVCNHNSMIDGPIVLPNRRNIIPMMKAKYASKPPYNVLTRVIGFISIDKEVISSLGAAMDAARKRLSEGTSLLVFPEGTRNGGKRLLPFMEIAFRLSIECKVPVVPVLLHMTQPFMSKEPGTWFPHKRNYITLRALPPVDPSGFNSADDMTEAVRVSMIRAYRSIENETKGL